MLKGKVAVVTGGAIGIGRSIAQKFAQNGASVAVIYHSNEEKARLLLEELGSSAKIYQCNIANFCETESVFNRIYADFGNVDILVNNAGITRDKLMLSMTERDFDDVIETNLKGSFNTIKQVYPHFAKRRAGHIINISSVAGIIGNAGQTNYSASKAGIIGLTKSVARELAARGVCCNAIAPGFIETDMTAAFTKEHPLVASIPMKRMGTPEEVAELALFLACTEYITGEIVRIDGGLAM